MLRQHEDTYTQLNLDTESITDDDHLNAMAAHPDLSNRPIVITATDARIYGPPELVFDLIE